MDRQILIIGGGASGMTAAIFAARSGASVTLLEHQDRVGKKILVTGNGRCNFTNRDQKPEYYRCGQPDFPWQVIRRFPMEDTLDFFMELGILPKERNGYLYPNSDQASSVLDVLRFEIERLGVWVVTNCHVSDVRIARREECAEREPAPPEDCAEREPVPWGSHAWKEPVPPEGCAGKEPAPWGSHAWKEPVPPEGCAGKEPIPSEECAVRGTGRREERGSGRGFGNGCGFVVVTDKGIFRGDALILAAGSKAAPSTGSDGSGYRIAERLGHRVLEPLPALVRLRSREKDFRQMAGVRTEGRVRLYVNVLPSHDKTSGGLPALGNGSGTGADERQRSRETKWRPVAEDTGEIQLTDQGISGIPVFQVSRYASGALYEHRQVKAVIDFLPRLTERQTEDLLLRRRSRARGQTCEQLMTGLLNKKLCLVLLKRAQIGAGEKTEKIPEKKWGDLLKQIKAFETYIAETGPFTQAQVCRGGVDTAWVNPATLESRTVPGLYFAGEILDVDGICGGYNLQWAWSSGAVAGRAAAGKSATGESAAGEATAGKAVAGESAAGEAGVL